MTDGPVDSPTRRQPARDADAKSGSLLVRRDHLIDEFLERAATQLDVTESRPRILIR
jgi:hypothetical protein